MIIITIEMGFSMKNIIYNDNNDKNDFNDIMIVWISHYIPTDKKDLNGAISWEHVMGHNGM